MHYEDFLHSKIIKHKPVGFDAAGFNDALIEFQKDVVKALATFGRGAGFLGTGLGKTLIQLNLGNEICQGRGDKVLILAPLSVAEQTAFIEAPKFGYRVNLCETMADVKPGINITNYQKLHKFDPVFDGLILDESSIIKADKGKTFKAVCAFGQNIPYRYAFSATPAPNSYPEFGNHAEFLGIMSNAEMRATFFEHDSSGGTGDWKLAGWGEDAFWRFLCSWSIFMNQPSDLGYSNDGFELPELLTEHCVVEGKLGAKEGQLISQSESLTDELRSRRLTIKERCERSYEIASSVDSDQFIIWCKLDDEQAELERLFGDSAVSIWGKTPDKKKIEMERYWREGGCQGLISKPQIFGYGLNWQNANNMIFCGIDNSWEMLHQATKRIHRKGQTKKCTRYLVYSEDDRRIWLNLERKQFEADYLNDNVRKYNQLYSTIHSATFRQLDEYNPQVEMKLPSFLTV